MSKDPLPARQPGEQAESPTPRPPEWASLAAEHRAAIEIGRRHRIRKIRFGHNGWTIVLEVTDPSGEGEHRTTFRVDLGTRVDCRLHIRSRHLLDRIGEHIGIRGIDIPDPDVEARFVARTDSESVTRSLLLDRKVTGALLGLRRVALTISPRRRRLRRIPNTATLCVTMPGIVKDRARLDAALTLTRNTLDTLIRIGVARTPSER